MCKASLLDSVWFIINLWQFEHFKQSYMVSNTF